MLRRILASAAILAMAAGGAAAQYVPSGAGLAQGAPLATDPVTGDPEAVGEDGVISEQFEAEQRTIVVPSERRAAVIPGFVPTFQGEGQYPSAPSEAGLTPGAPLGGDTNDGKSVAGQ